MATWPTAEEALEYIGEVTAEQIPVLEGCLAAAVDYIAWRCDENVTLDEDDTPIISPSLREAALMLTGRLLRRRLSPEGVSSFGEFGAVRVTWIDPDVERLITPSRSWGIA